MFVKYINCHGSKNTCFYTSIDYINSQVNKLDQKIYIFIRPISNKLTLYSDRTKKSYSVERQIN